MEKISLGALLLLCLLAIATANTFTVTVAATLTEDDIKNLASKRCQEQIQRHRLNHCRMLLSRSRPQYYEDELSMVTEDEERNQGQEYLQQCCQELRNMDSQCRCQALGIMVAQEHGSLGPEGEGMLGRARFLPRACNIEPTQCHF